MQRLKMDHTRGSIKVLVRRATYKGGKQIEADPKLDWAGNLAHMMGTALTHAVIFRGYGDQASCRLHFISDAFWVVQSAA